MDLKNIYLISKGDRTAMIRMDEEMVINPVLMLAISRMRENDTPETREKMLKAAES